MTPSGQAARSGQAGSTHIPSSPDVDWPDVDLSGVTELHVHGVGGTEASELLETPMPVQVSGDHVAGVLRAPDRADGSLRWHLEAYSWGGLTAGVGSNVLWLLFLPMSLVNMSGWMTPMRTAATDDGHRLASVDAWAAAAHRGLVRTLGLGVTAGYVLFAVQVSMDFAAYQCGGTGGCAVAGWLQRAPGWVSSTSVRTALGAVPPLLLVALLWWLMHRSRSRYELFAGDREPAAGGDRRTRGGHGDDEGSDNPARCGLTDPRFWSGQGFASQLAAVHIAAGLVVVAALVAATTRTSTDSAVAGPLVVGAALAGAVTVVMAANRTVRDLVPRRALVGTAGALVALALLDAFLAPVTAPSAGLVAPAVPHAHVGQLPGLRETFNGVLAVVFASAAALLVVDLHLAVRARRRGAVPGWRTTLRQVVTPYSVVVVAVLLTAAPLCGAALWVARRLGTTSSALVGDAQIVYAHPIESFARGLVASPLIAVTGVAVGATVAGLTRSQRLGAALRRLVDAWRPTRPDGRHLDARSDRAWRRQLGRKLAEPSIALSAGQWLLWAVAGVTTVLTAAYAGYASWHTLHDRHDRYLDVHVGWVAGNLPSLDLSIWLLTFLPVLAAFLLRRALRHPGTNRLLSIAWDVGTFWPRSFHPLAPPSYAERAVPELRTRLTRIWDSGGRVVLCGHSQGSVLATAAIAVMTDGDGAGDPPSLVGKLSLVTYGSPVTRLYARFFPAYVDADLLVEVRRRLTGTGPAGGVRWRNFHRDTDLVGGRVDDADVLVARGLDEVDAYLPDPASPLYRAGDGRPRVRGHGHRGYREQRAFDRYVVSEVERLSSARTAVGAQVPLARSGSRDEVQLEG